MLARSVPFNQRLSLTISIIWRSSLQMNSFATQPLYEPVLPSPSVPFTQGHFCSFPAAAAGTVESPCWAGSHSITLISPSAPLPVCKPTAGPRPSTHKAGGCHHQPGTHVLETWLSTGCAATESL